MMRCFSNVLKKNIAPDVIGDVLEEVKHRTNDASNDVSRPALPCRDILVGLVMHLFWGEKYKDLWFYTLFLYFHTLFVLLLMKIVKGNLTKSSNTFLETV